jgi:hypothetical protein
MREREKIRDDVVVVFLCSRLAANECIKRGDLFLYFIWMKNIFFLKNKMQDELCIIALLNALKYIYIFINLSLCVSRLNICN